MLQIITPDFRKKIEMLVSKHGSANALGNALGVSNTTVSNWIGSGEFIRDKAYEKLLQEMLRYGIITPGEMSVYKLGLKNVRESSNAELYVPEKAVQKFPVISDAAAAECNTAFMPISDYAEINAEDQVSFTEGKEGDVVIRVTGSSMSPWYPPGTLILVRPNQRLQTGERVVAVLKDGEVVFKCFAEKGDKYYLLSINQSGKDYEFRKDEYNPVRAVYTVIQSMRDEKALDRAMAEAGIHHFWETKLKELN